jgi:ribose transport system ATP-binding protein
MQNTPIVSLKNISKTFGATRALNNVSVDLYKKQVHCFAGVNGAGKSTLMKILLGVTRQDAGEIIISGEKVDFKSPIEAMERGVSMVFQELNLFPKTTVAENILLANYPRRRLLINWREGFTLVGKFLNSLQIDIDPRTKIENLSLHEQQLIEIAKSVYFDPKILILDEPTSSLSYNEAQILYSLVRRLKQKGLAIAFITHNMDEILDLSDRITVLRDAECVSQGETANYNAKIIIDNMLGSSADFFEKKSGYVQNINEKLLQVTKLQYKNSLKNINFHVFKGEILAFTGLVGSGISDLARTLFGIHGKFSGIIETDEKQFLIKNPVSAIKNGIGYLPISRKEEGIFHNFNVRQNVTITIINAFKAIISRIKEKRIAEKFCAVTNVKMENVEVSINSLSGGNQQKVVLSRWLAKKPRILLLDDPTRGIDVGAKKEIYNALRDIVKDGSAIILMSSEIDEILSASDRIYVMREGAIISELLTRDTDKKEILHYAMLSGPSE